MVSRLQGVLVFACLLFAAVGPCDGGTLRIVTWNVVNRPCDVATAGNCDAAEPEAFRTIFGAMDRPDVLFLQEADQGSIAVLIDLNE